MKKNIQLLGSILALQVGLIFFFATRKEPTATFESGDSLLSVAFDNVDELVIQEKAKDDKDKKEPITLAKENGTWKIPAHFNFPASDEKVRDFVKAMKEIKKSWPVGKTQIAAKKFALTEDHFERKVEFKEKGKILATLYLGDSPGYKKVYARVDGNDQSYSISYGVHELPLDAKQWEEKNIYRVERTKLKEIELNGLTLVGKDGLYEVKDLGEKEATDTAKTANLLSKVEPRYEDVLGNKKDVQKGGLILEYSLKTDAETIKYSFYHDNKAQATGKDPKDKTQTDEKVILEVSNLDYAFLVKKTAIEDLLKIERSSYIKDKTAQATESTTSSAEQTTPKEGASNINIDAPDSTVSTNEEPSEEDDEDYS